MRALLCNKFGAPREVLSIEDAPMPEITQPDEVIVRVHYASVSHATGLMIEGKYQRKPPFPFSPGTEAVGVIEKTGSAVGQLAVGQRVACICDWGAYAEYVKLPKYTVYPIPDEVEYLSALPIPISYGTAYLGLVQRCRLTPDQTVLVLGAGSGVGLAAVEIAATLGCRVIACASTPEKCQVAAKAGAVATLTGSDQLAAQVKQLTAGKGVDIIFDPVGGALFAYALRAAAQNAQLISIGFASGKLPEVAMNIVLVKNLTIHGFFFGQYTGWTPADERIMHASMMSGVMSVLFRWVAEKKLNPDVQKVFSLDQIPEAIETLHARSITGKLAVKPN
ncbi:MAG: NADPH:quinone oxidoreductase family protein [Advenella sp.]|nr:NADPH:quinone oxidoreductase family protein [Advenella sp.]